MFTKWQRKMNTKDKKNIAVLSMAWNHMEQLRVKL